VYVLKVMLRAMTFTDCASEREANKVADPGDVVPCNTVFLDDRGAAGWPGTLQNGRISGGHLVADETDLFGPLPGSPFGPDPAAPFGSSELAELVWTTAFVCPLSTRPGDMIEVDVAAIGPWALTWRLGADGATSLAVEERLFGLADGGAADGWRAVEQPWPGRIPAEPDAVVTFTLRCRGAVTSFVVRVVAPNLAESWSDLPVPPGGLRLPITHDYWLIKRVVLTLPQDQASGMRAIVLDIDPRRMKRVQHALVEEQRPAARVFVVEMDGKRGPLVRYETIDGAPTAGRIDAYIEGY
jgi:hypothetical protein